jgi:hypothetical protein
VPQGISRRLAIILKIFTAISCVYLYIFYSINLSRSVIASSGISDEGFLLNQVNGRSVEGIQDWYLPYTDFLVVIWDLAGYNLPVFRTFGILIYLAILIPTIVILTIKSRFHLSMLAQILIFSISGLGLSRYLLVTPGYQYLSLIFSVGAIVPTLYLIKSLNKELILPHLHSFLILAFLSLSGLVIFSARISGGIVFYFVILVALILEIRPATAVRYFIIIATPTILAFFLNINNWRDRIFFTYSLTQLYDPEGYSLVSEVIDIATPLFPMLSSFFIAFLVSKGKRNINWIQIPMLMLLGAGLIYSQVNRLTLFLICVMTYLLSDHLLKNQNVTKSLSVILVAITPFLTVFGSNTPAAGNHLNLLIGLVLVYFFSIQFSVSPSKGNLPSIVKAPNLFFVSLALLTLVYLASTTQTTGYGKRLPDLNLLQRVQTTAYHELTLEYLDKQAFPASPRKNPRILDLTKFNPGLIYLVKGLPYPVSLSYGSRGSQVISELGAIRESMKKYGIHEGDDNYILVQMASMQTSECVRLTDAIADKSLASYLVKTGWSSRYSVKILIENKSEKLRFGIMKACDGKGI